MKKILVIGAGLVGRTIAINLADRYSVSVIDQSDHAIDLTLQTSARLKRNVQANVGSTATIDHQRLKDFDLVVNALPGFVGYTMTKRIIEAGRNIVDISFFAEDPYTLDEIAKKNGVIAVVDCGVAPGLCNMMLGDALRNGKVNSYACYVGGLPYVRTTPWEYKAPYSPADVIQFYLRPARLVENGVIVTKPALTEIEPYQTPIGSLEAFNTDGLRSLLSWSSLVPNMKEKTLRYPGYANKILMLKDSGFFDTDLVRVDGHNISPLEVTSALLKKSWALDPEEKEFTFMEVIIDNLTYRVFDQTTDFSSMSRTTGFTCSAVATAILEGNLNTDTGIITPEQLGLSGNLGMVLAYLLERGVSVAGKKALVAACQN
jgi:lysine 6-dehydrogenase